VKTTILGTHANTRNVARNAKIDWTLKK